MGNSSSLDDKVDRQQSQINSQNNKINSQKMKLIN